MRRPALLAFALFAIAASLPAEVRECLPRAAACERPAVRRSCPMAKAARPGAGGARCPLGERKAPPCTPSRNPFSDDCRLHATPDGTAPRVAQALPRPTIPVAIVAIATVVSLPAGIDPSRRGWLEAPALRPRAAPRAAPYSPRPPPFVA